MHLAILETKDLTYQYGVGTPFQKTAVEQVSISIRQGEFLGVIGHTGSGKSTLIQMLNGLIKPTSGQVLLDGKDIWEEPKKIRAVRFRVGMVFQYPEYQLFEETVYKDIAFGPTNMGMHPDQVNSMVEQAARFVGLGPELMQKSPFELSGGQKRRVAIAGVIAMNPEVLILDEPASGLDPKGRDDILGQIKDYHAESKKTVILVSHSMEDIARYCNRVLVMNQSKVYLYDETEKIFSRAAELERIGLALPQISRIINRIAAKGYDIPTNIYTLERGKEELLKLLAAKGVKRC